MNCIVGMKEFEKFIGCKEVTRKSAKKFLSYFNIFGVKLVAPYNTKKVGKITQTIKKDWLINNVFHAGVLSIHRFIQKETVS